MTQEKKPAPTAVERFEQLAGEFLAAEKFVREFREEDLDDVLLGFKCLPWLHVTGFPRALDRHLQGTVRAHVRQDLEAALRELRTEVQVAGVRARAEIKARLQSLDQVIEGVKEAPVTTAKPEANES